MNREQTQEPTSIKQAIQAMIPESMTVLRGVVQTASPLMIQVINDPKMIPSENILCLPRHLSDYSTTVDITLGTGTIDSATREEQGHSHNLETFTISGASMTVHNALKAGEIVYLLSFNHGKKYYVLDREVM